MLHLKASSGKARWVSWEKEEFYRTGATTKKRMKQESLWESQIQDKYSRKMTGLEFFFSMFYFQEDVLMLGSTPQL